MPYDYPEEMEAWLLNGVQKSGVVLSESKTDAGAVQVSISQDEQTSPMWFTVQDGNTVGTCQGPLQDDEIVRLLSAVTA